MNASPRPSATVELRAVTKHYGVHDRQAAVRDVSFTVERGEFFSLLGPSGCGKSTTLRMIAGLEPISEGTVYVDGVPINHVAARDRDMAMVFQSYALYPHMTVADNMAFGLRRRGLPAPEIAARVQKAADMLGLAELGRRKPHALSGGQRQRVALGRAIVRDPRVFLFDEPLSNLDASLRASTRSEIIRLHQRLGTTMIYVTHDQAEAMTMSDRLCIMDRGAVVQVGRPLDVYRNPRSTFVARFLGSSPMNLFTATVVSADQQQFAQFAEFRLPLTRWRGQKLEARMGVPVTVGIRPEDLRLAPDAETRPALVGGQVKTVEPLGAETYLMVEVGGVTLNVRAEGDCAARVGDRLDLHVRTNALHLFDAESSLAIPGAA